MNREPTQIPYGPPISPNLPVTTGPMVREPQKTIEINRRATGAGVSLGGAFFTKYTNDDGDTFLQGGEVKSGSGNFLIADMKVIDHTTGPVETDGDKLVLEATVDGYVVDGVLLAGLTATAAAYITPSVSTIPADTLPTLASPTGRKVYIEIGRWTATDFLPAYPGNIRIAFCPGAYQITRF